MALSYRSPVEEVLNRFTSEEQSRVGAAALARMAKKESDNCQFFSYALPERAKERLMKVGIYLSPFSYEAHSHPVCKTLENHILYNIIANKIDNDFYCVGIKNSKFNFIKSRNRSLSMVSYLNRLVTSVDKYRYGSDFTCVNSRSISGLEEKKSFFDSPTLCDLLPLVKLSKKKKMFIHDELHYWNKKDLMVFLDSVKPEVVLATMVFPPEILAGAKQSLNPWCYEFEIIKNELHFFPDGVRSEAYSQPLSSGLFLKASKIICPSGDVYSIDVVYSAFSHHIVSITKGNLLNQRRRFFSNFDAVGVDEIQGLSDSIRDCIPVPYEVVSKIYRYIRTLKKPDSQSCIAKLSQIVPNPTGFEIKFVEDFSKLVRDFGTTDTLIRPNLAKIFGAFLCSMLPFKVARVFDCYVGLSLDYFIHNLKPFSFNLKTEVIDPNSDFIFDALSLGESCDHDSILRKLDSFYSGKSETVPCLAGQFPYCHDIYQGALHLLAGFSLNSIKRIGKRFLQSYVGEHSITITASEAASMFTNWVAQHLGVPILFCFGEKFEAELITSMRKYHGVFVACVKNEFSNNQSLWFKIPNLRHYRKWIKFEEFKRNSYAERPKNLNSSIIAFDRKVLRPILNLEGCSVEKLETKSSIEEFHYESVDQHQASQASDMIGGTVDEFESLIFKGEVKLSEESPFQLGSGASSSATILFNAISDDLTDAGQVEIEELKLPKISVEDEGESGYFLRRCNCIENLSERKLVHLEWPEFINTISSTENEYYNYGYILPSSTSEGALTHEKFEKGNLGFATNRSKVVNLFGKSTLSVRKKNRFIGDENLDFELNNGDSFTMSENFDRLFEWSIIPNNSNVVVIVLKCVEVNRKKELIKHSCDQPPSGVLFGVDIKIEQGISEDNFHKFDVPGDGDCFWHSVGALIGLDGLEIKKTCKTRFDRKKVESSESLELSKQLEDRVYAEREAIAWCCLVHNIKMIVFFSELRLTFVFEPRESSELILLHLSLSKNHFQPCLPKNGCVVKSISEALNQIEGKVLAVLGRKENRHLLDIINDGQGIGLDDLESVFMIFDIRANLQTQKGTFVLNPDGRLEHNFEMNGDHITYIKAKVGPLLLEPKHVLTNHLIFNFQSQMHEICSQIPYLPNKDRALILEKSLLQGDTGILCDQLINCQEPWFNESTNWDLSFRELSVLLGTFGSGKSHIFKRMIKANPAQRVIFVSPRRSLADQLKRDLALNEGRKLKGKNNEKQAFSRVKVLTLEIFLKGLKSCRDHCLVFDEIQLYPPGYIDLVLLFLGSQANGRVFLCGDPCQSDYDSNTDRITFSGSKADIFEILEGKQYKYNIMSKRFKSDMFVGRLPCEIDRKGIIIENGEFDIVQSMDEASLVGEHEYQVVLVSSFEEKKMVHAHLGRDKMVLTFGESTGLTFNSGMVIVSHESSMTNEKRWLTALSRFRENIIFVNLISHNIEDTNQLFSGRALSDFLTKRSSFNKILEMLPGEPKFVKGFEDMIGRSEGLKEEKLQGDPWLKSELDLAQEEDQELEEMQEALIEEPWFKTHLPLIELEPLRARWVHLIKDREAREVRCGTEVSQQFPDDHDRSNGAQLTNAAERFEAIYPRHRGSDSVTFLMAVKKRLKFSRPSVEAAKFRRAKPYGKFLLKEFLKKIPLKGNLNQTLLDDARKEFEEKKVSKSSAVLENHAGRSCRDWLADVAFIFMKSQYCSKWDNRFRDAKAGQTLACFHHSVLCRFAPFIRYIEKKVNEAIPSNFYIHSGKNIDDLNVWVKKNGFSGVCTESDYEAFDSSQDHYILAFEVEVMKHLNLPWDLIEDYCYIKLHLGSKLGNFSIMRFTGEASTFLFNTMANMLFTFLRYDMNGKEGVCFAGDDMCANTRLKVSKTHEKFLSKLSLKAKVQFTDRPTFCGWNLCSAGVFKRPQLVLERLCVAREKKNLENCLDSYAIEVSYAFRMGELVKDFMDEEAMDNHYNCVRFIVKNAHLLKSSVKDLYLSRVQ